jgi:hypothetical protein
MKINRFQVSKLFTSGTMMVFVFYVILAIFSVGFVSTSTPGLNVIQLLFIPIIAGIAGMGWGAYNLSFDEKEPWKRGRIIFILISTGTIFLLLGQIGLIIAGYDDVQKIAIRPSFVSVGNVFMILSCLILAVGFFFLRKQLKEMYFKKIFIKNPNIFIVFSYLLLAIAYSLFFAAYFTAQGNALTILDGIGIGFTVVSLIFLLVGFIPINIAFRTYPHLVEDEGLRK